MAPQNHAALPLRVSVREASRREAGRSPTKKYLFLTQSLIPSDALRAYRSVPFTLLCT